MCSCLSPTWLPPPSPPHSPCLAPFAFFLKLLPSIVYLLLSPNPTRSPLLPLPGSIYLICPSSLLGPPITNLFLSHYFPSPLYTGLFFLIILMQAFNLKPLQFLSPHIDAAQPAESSNRLLVVSPELPFYS